MKKTLIALILSAFGAVSYAQQADCAITYRNDNAYQGQLLARIGNTIAVPWDSKNYTWNMATAFTVPAGTVVNKAKVVLPTISSGNSYGYATAAIVYLTIIPGYSGDNTCAGYGPGFIGVSKPKVDNSTTVLAGTYTFAIPSNKLEMQLNAKSLDILRAHVGDETGVVFGISMNVPRMPIYKDGEWTKTNQPGTIVDFNRTSACNTQSTSEFCPTLLIN